MNWQAISAVAETVAAIGVIFSLLYVGVQVRQSTRQMRLDTLRSVVSELGRVHDSLALHGDLGEIALRGFQDYESLTTVERVRFSGYLAHMFKLFEQLYVLHEAAAIEDEDWTGFANAIADLGSYPGVQTWLGTRSHWMRSDFLAYVRGVTRTAPGNIFLEAQHRDTVGD